jgi:hypothetical protein
LTPTELLAAAQEKGWRDLSAAVVTRTLVNHPELFEHADGDQWTLAPGAEHQTASAAKIPEQRQEDEEELFVPHGDEWYLKGLPSDPRDRHTFLEVYRRVKAEQDTIPKVWVAGKGELYHWDSNCFLLRGGRAVALERGQGLSWVKAVTEHEAHQMQRDECSRCARGTGSTRRR